VHDVSRKKIACTVLRLRHNVALRPASDQKIGGGTARAIGHFVENSARHWAQGIFNLK